LRGLVVKRPSSVAVLGGTDSGKTTFCIMLANHAVRARLRVALIDGDIGQAELGAPTTVSMAFIKEQTIDLFPLTAGKAYFVGTTTPSVLPGRLIDDLEKLQRAAAEKGADLVVLNTDGWVEGLAAIEHKAGIINRLRPDVCIMLQSSQELQGLAEAVGRTGCQTIMLPVPPSIKKRSREERRELRQLRYRKALKGLACRTMRLGQVRLEAAAIGGGIPLAQGRIDELAALLGSPVLYGEQEATGLTVVVDEHGLHAKRQAPLPAESAPAVRIVPAGVERGLIAGLLGKHDELLALGIIEEIDYVRGVVKVLTGYRAPVDAIQVGQVRLDRDCRELAQYASSPLAGYTPR